MFGLEDRMKEYYENRYRIKLTRRMPVILRLDGKAFHTYTKGMEKPCDSRLIATFQNTTQRLLEEIQGAKVAYTQSDEISLMLTDFDELNTDAWFDYNLQKMVSVAASYCTAIFNAFRPNNQMALFDCRAFNVPREDVCNYFVCRQQDCMRNAISATAQSLFSHKELQGKSCKDMLEMMEAKDFDFYHIIPESFRFGSFYSRNEDVLFDDIKENREFVECFLN